MQVKLHNSVIFYLPLKLIKLLARYAVLFHYAKIIIVTKR